MVAQLRNAEMVDLLSTDFQRQYDSAFASIGTSMYRWLPGLRGFWPMTAIDGSGNFLDQSGNGLTLTNNNTAKIYYSGLAGFTRFTAASSESATRADEAAFDITGAEAYINGLVQGLTVMCWTQAVTLPGTTMNIVSKWRTATNERSYRLTVNTLSQFQFGISGDGTATHSVAATVAATTTPWYFVAGRYDQNTPKVDLFVNNAKYTNNVGTPAALFSGSANFAVATNHGLTELYDGRIALVALCAASLSDAIILTLYHKTRAMFGVR